jgi:methionyl-tRNA formyltransferase
MTENLPRIVFMGTPAFAVASLGALHETGFPVVGVVTSPDKPAGRGQKISVSPVKEYALEHNLSLFQPEKLRDASFITALSQLNADIFVVVAFRMLPQEVWSIPPLGTFNLHASLLPQYRGAAPINHALMNGETKTGVTTFLIDKEIDTGNILLARETDIGPGEDAGSLHDRLMTMGATLVIETAKGLFERRLRPVPQALPQGPELKQAPKIFPPDTIINWRDPASRVHDKIRGLSPYPGAVTTLHSDEKHLRIKIFGSRVIDNVTAIPGTIILSDKSRFIISCSVGALEVTSVQPEGRKRMTGAEFLRGFDPAGWELV